MNVTQKFECDICSGKYKLSHRDFDFFNLCPKHRAMFKVKRSLEKEDFSGFSPAPFVGRFGYPRINVGILSTPDSGIDRDTYDNPKLWSLLNYQIDAVAELRSSLVNSSFKAEVTDARKSEKFLDIGKEIGMASKAVDIEVQLHDKPKFRINFGEYTAPTGPNAKLKKAEITSNPKIDNKVEKVVDDIDLKANKGIVYLYSQGFDENFLSRLLSIGNVGLKKDRKLVPTRWSITAVDDALGKDLIKKIHDNSLLDYRLYFGGFMGNYYCLLFFPEVWSYELFEMEAKQQKEIHAMTDNEGYNSRKEYAFNTAGGYYTVRLAILEKLNEMKRQGSCLALRFITDEYKLPLGVWITREAARKTLAEKAMTFSSKELMLGYVQGLILKKFGMNIGQIFRKSKLLNEIKEQKKLSEY